LPHLLCLEDEPLQRGPVLVGLFRGHSAEQERADVDGHPGVRVVQDRSEEGPAHTLKRRPALAAPAERAVHSESRSTGVT
jgi:hypothetical protein